MDITSDVELAKLNRNFIDFVVKPYWELLPKLFPTANRALSNLNENREYWQDLVERCERDGHVKLTMIPDDDEQALAESQLELDTHERNMMLLKNNASALVRTGVGGGSAAVQGGMSGGGGSGAVPAAPGSAAASVLADASSDAVSATNRYSLNSSVVEEAQEPGAEQGALPGRIPT